jgi:hypothetical protein
MATKKPTTLLHSAEQIVEYVYDGGNVFFGLAQSVLQGGVQRACKNITKSAYDFHGNNSQ